MTNKKDYDILCVIALFKSLHYICTNKIKLKVKPRKP